MKPADAYGQAAYKKETVMYVARVFGFTVLALAALAATIGYAVAACGIGIGPGPLF